MSTNILVNGSLLVDEATRESAQLFVERAHDRNITEGSLSLDDGTTVQLDQNLAELLQFVIRGLPSGTVSMRAMPSELTSTSAAGLLGVSRPTLMKMVTDGVLSSHTVGAHHRFTLEDITSLAESRRAARLNAFAELRALDEAFETSEDSDDSAADSAAPREDS
jgi:excisionase family DNA binding protein